MKDFEDFSFEEFDSDTSKAEHLDSDAEEENDSYEGSYMNADMIETTFSDSAFTPMSDEETDALQDYDTLSKEFNNVFASEASQDSKTVHEDNVHFISEKGKEEQRKADEAAEETKKLFIKCMEWVVETIAEGVSTIEKTSSDKKHVREYNKKAEMPKISYAKPKEEGSSLKKLMLFLIACACVGVFMGIKANSYYVLVGGKATATSCAFSWLMQESMPYVFTPFYANIFVTAFFIGFGILGVIGLFIWLDSDAKKQSRVGHEHGKAHLGSSKDFKTFKNRFMEK